VATTVHIPDRLLAEVDRRARSLRISRNRLIVRALEREVDDTTSWSPGFLDALRRVEPGTAEAADEMLAVIRRRRRSKPAPRL
jgi:predicted transcriptional regulator